MKAMYLTIAALATTLLLTNGASAQIVVNSFAPASPEPIGEWYLFDVRNSGTADIVDLTGQGGNLENAQPLPTDAARLTTGPNTADKAEVGIIDTYGTIQQVLSTLELEYSFYKANVASTNLAAAPSLKLTIYNSTCDDPASAGDCFGTLVYEPTWNGPGSTSPTPPSTNPSLDVWTPVTIDADSGLFWWTGGFGQPNTAGGPPARTLNEWLAIMSSDFQDAIILRVSIGVGTFNVNQLGYFDDVRIAHGFGGGFDKRYDFELVPANKADCMNDGWQAFGFRNQGLCIKFVNDPK